MENRPLPVTPEDRSPQPSVAPASAKQARFPHQPHPQSPSGAVVRWMLGAVVFLAAIVTVWGFTSASHAGSRDAIGYALYLPLCFFAAIIILQAGRVAQQGRAWLLIGLGVLAWACGEAAYAYLDAIANRPAFPGLPDIFYLSFIPLFAAGLLFFPRERLSGGGALGFILDTAVTIVVVANLLWITAVKHTFAEYADQPLELLLSVAYPLTDLLLSAVLLMTAMWRPRGLTRLQLALLAGGMGLFLLADIGYALQESRDAYTEWGVIDMGWTWGIVLFAWAAYAAIPSGRVRFTDRLLGPSARQTSMARQALPHIAIAISSGALVVLHVNTDHRSEVAVGLGVVTLLVLARQLVALFDNQRLAWRLEGHAHRDALTNLHSRAALLDYVNDAVREAGDSDRFVAVLHIDLDRMKRINDWYGHVQGDLVLQEVARRLQPLVRHGDMIARFSGDEFVLVLRQLTAPGDVTVVADRLREQIAQPIVLSGDQLYLTASVGVSLYPNDGGDGELTLHYAYLALQQAKQHGRNTIRYYDNRLTDALVNRSNLESHLRQVLASNGLTVHYQALQHLKTEQLVGFEALVRWNSPVVGTVSPATLISLAEETGLIVPLGDFVLRQAIRDVQRWRESIHPQLYVAVNVSALQFNRADYVQTVRRALDEAQLSGDALMLELTESSLVSDIVSSQAKILELKAFGVRVALDDFGTGFSSLSSLRQLPVDVLKIDRSFVRSVLEDGPAFIQAITDLAHHLNLRVVVEGIESVGVYALMTELGCDVGQGYFIGRPESAGQVHARYEPPLELVLEG